MESVGEAADLDRLKLKFNPWNSDKEDFTMWMMGVMAVVRSLRHGNELEDWLDIKLDRVIHQSMMVSSLNLWAFFSRDIGQVHFSYEVSLLLELCLDVKIFCSWSLFRTCTFFL